MNNSIDAAKERKRLASIALETYLRCDHCAEEMNCHEPSGMWIHRGAPICEECAEEAEIPAEDLDCAPDPTCTAMRLLDALDAKDAEIERLRTALAWYGEQARLCGLIHSEGDAGRHMLSADGGTLARAALNGEGEQ